MNYPDGDKCFIRQSEWKVLADVEIFIYLVVVQEQRLEDQWESEGFILRGPWMFHSHESNI